MNVTNDMAEAALDALDDACIGFQRSRNPSASVHWKGFTRDDRVSAMRTALSAALAKQDAAIALMRGQSWQDIATLEEGAEALLFCEDYAPHFFVGSYTMRSRHEDVLVSSKGNRRTYELTEVKERDWGDAPSYGATHWQPLPAPPKDTADE